MNELFTEDSNLLVEVVRERILELAEHYFSHLIEVQSVFLVGDSLSDSCTDESVANIVVVAGPAHEERLAEAQQLAFAVQGMLDDYNDHPHNYFVLSEDSFEPDKGLGVYNVTENKWVEGPSEKMESLGYIRLYQRLQQDRLADIDMSLTVSEQEDTSEEDQDEAVEMMLQRYLAEPINLWLYSDLPVADRMALAYLSADNMMGAPYQGDQVRQFIEALKMTTAEPNSFWEQIKEKDEHRYERLKDLEWSLEVVPLDRVGVWPHFGGFPREWGYGSVVDTAAALATGFDEPEKRHRVLSMVSKWMTILKFLPPILVPGGRLRGKDPNYEVFDYDIDDGNHRAVAAAIGGAKSMIAFVGRAKGAKPTEEPIQALDDEG